MPSVILATRRLPCTPRLIIITPLPMPSISGGVVVALETRNPFRSPELAEPPVARNCDRYEAHLRSREPGALEPSAMPRCRARLVEQCASNRPTTLRESRDARIVAHDRHPRAELSDVADCSISATRVSAVDLRRGSSPTCELLVLFDESRAGRSSCGPSARGEPSRPRPRGLGNG